MKSQGPYPRMATLYTQRHTGARHHVEYTWPKPIA